MKQELRQLYKEIIVLNQENTLETIEVQNAKISYYGSRQQVERYYWDKIKNYILEVINEVRWIEIDGKRYSPRQILQNFRSRNNQRFVGIVPVIGIEMLEKIAEAVYSNLVSER